MGKWRTIDFNKKVTRRTFAKSLFIFTSGLWVPRMGIARGVIAAPAGGTWQTAWDPAVANSLGTSGARNYRNILNADVSSFDGTKIRITVKGESTSSKTLDGSSIGVMSAVDDFDAAPTRITWDGGANGCTLGVGTATKVSDEITFSFDKTIRHGIHFYMANRIYWIYKNIGSYGIYYNSTAADDTLTQAVVYTPEAGTTYLVDKLEVYA